MSVAEELLDDALELISEGGQAVTLRRKTSGSVAAGDGSITPAHRDYAGFAVFGEQARRMASYEGRSREVPASREVCYLAAKDFETVPVVGDDLYRAETASGTAQRVELVDPIRPGDVTVLWRLEVAR